MNLKAEFLQTVQKLRRTKPVVQHLTNYVTAESCADICLAAGASPIMADAVQEAEVIAGTADATVLNLGTLHETDKTAFLLAAASAHAAGKPVVLDPAGVMGSQYRLDFALQLLDSGNVDILRGNLAECMALTDGKAVGRGLDSTTDSSDKGMSLQVAKDLAKKYGVTVALTGAADYISDGTRALMLNNGHPLLQEITGAGCMTTSLIGCCAACCDDRLTAAALGVLILGQGAELAANFLEKKDGPGLFKARLVDGVYHVTTKWEVLNLQDEKRV